MPTIICFCIVYGSTVGNVTTMRNFGGTSDKFGAFGISRDTLWVFTTRRICVVQYLPGM
jgi:hypothetical protein